MPSLTVLLDHVAGLRQSMQTTSPDPVVAAALAELAGADGIGVYLREDRKHSVERDVRLLRQTIQSRLILHMAATSEMMGIALDIKPERVVLMPELRDDVRIDNGIDLVVRGKELFETIDTLQSNSISVGVCISPEPDQAKIAHQLRANWIQIHAGRLSAARSAATQRQEWDRIIDTIKMGYKLRLQIAIGHGLDDRLLKLFKGIGEIDEFSLGRSLVAKALFVGMEQAVRQSIALLNAL
jgi:pyridoxine 5-phosphate synthase